MDNLSWSILCLLTCFVAEPCACIRNKAEGSLQCYVWRLLHFVTWLCQHMPSHKWRRASLLYDQLFMVLRHVNLRAASPHSGTDYRGSDPKGSDTRGSDPVGSDTRGSDPCGNGGCK